MTITSAEQWADALDTHMRETGQSAGTLTSEAYAAGEILGVTLDPTHPAADDERPTLVADCGWAVQWVPSHNWWHAADPALWTLAHEADGTDDAAWTLRHGTGADTTVYDVNTTLRADDTHAARSWATMTLAQRHGVTVTGWTPHRPGPGTAPAHWTAHTDA